MRKGGHLAHIPDEHHQIEIYNFVQQHHGDAGVWIGLNDRQDEKNYQWASGINRNTYFYCQIVLDTQLRVEQVEMFLHYFKYTVLFALFCLIMLQTFLLFVC